MNPLLSCIVVNYNTAAMTKKVITTFIESAQEIDFEIIVIDNASKESLPSFSDPRIKIIKNTENVGFANAVNQCLVISEGDYILLLNSDVFISAPTLKTLLDYMRDNSQCGIIGPRMNFPTGDFQASVGYEPNWRREFFRFFKIGQWVGGGTLLYQNFFTQSLFRAPHRVDWLSGGCMLIRKKIIHEIGILDPNFFFSIEDFDFCHRARLRGYDVVYLPTVSVVHHHGYSSGGHGSAQSLEHEKKSMNYYLVKHYPKKKLFKTFVMSLYSLKLFYLHHFRSS